MVDHLLELLHTQTLVVLFVVLGFGYLVGRVGWKGFTLGPVAGVLFAGLVFGHFGFEVNEAAQTFGFAMFIFCVGFQAGPRFVDVMVEDGLKYLSLALVVAVTGFVLAAALGRILELQPGATAGLLAGALTTTPTLAAAQDAIQSGLAPVPEGWSVDEVVTNIGTGYAITYLFGVIGLILAWSYNGPPGRFAYRGLGELDVAICYGPLICISTYLIQLGEVTRDVVLVSIPLGILIAAFLWINEFPDYDADRKVQKRNLIVRLGRHRASRLLPLIYGSAFLLVALLPLAGLPHSIWLGGFAMIPAAWLVIRTWQDPEQCYRHTPVSAGALATFLSLSLGMGVGVII